MASVQFYGKEQVMQIYENRSVDAWSIFQGKQFIHKGKGPEELEAFLDMLEAGQTVAAYTLKIYEDISDTKAIKEKTECDGSYNFKLTPAGENGVGALPNYFRTPNTTNAAILKRLEDLENERLETVQEDEPEEETIQGAIGKAVVQAIEDPDKLLRWVEVIKGLFNNSPAQPPTIIRQLDPPAALGKVGNTDTAAPVIDDEKVNRIYMAVEHLSKADPKLMEHLETLAIMAQDKPVKFKSLLLMLENF